MTSNIQQQVIPRHRASTPRVFLTNRRGWQASSQQRTTFFTRRTLRTPFNSGSVSHSTMTLGFAIVALVTVSVLAFLYLGQVFTTASQGTDIQDLEARVIELNEEQRRLELEGAQLRSIQSVEQQVQELNLITDTQVAYLAPTPERVAYADEQ